jgi:hypothetical protein
MNFKYCNIKTYLKKRVKGVGYLGGTTKEQKIFLVGVVCYKMMTKDI